MDRNLSTKIPDGATTAIAYDILGFDGQARFVTRVTDAQGKQRTSYRDARELITKGAVFIKWRAWRDSVVAHDTDLHRCTIA